MTLAAIAALEALLGRATHTVMVDAACGEWLCDLHIDGIDSLYQPRRPERSYIGSRRRMAYRFVDLLHARRLALPPPAKETAE